MVVKGINESIGDEDVLYALPLEAYRALIHFLLKVFSVEKAKLE